MIFVQTLIINASPPHAIPTGDVNVLNYIFALAHAGLIKNSYFTFIVYNEMKYI